MKKLAVFKIVIISCFTTLAVKLYVQADSGKTSGPALLDSTTGQLNSSQSPRPFVPINGPIIVSATGSKTQTYSSTSTAYQSATATFTATGSGVSAGTDTNSATGTATGTLTATTTTTGTQVLTLTGTATGTSTGTQWTAEIGNPSSGSYLFNVNNLLGVDKNGFVWFPPLGNTQLHVQQEYNAFTNGAVYTLHNPGLRINVFGSEGSAYLGGVSNAGGGDAPFSVMGFGSYLPGRIWMRGSRYGDPTQLTTTPILSIGGSVGGVPDKFRVLGNGQMYTQNMLTLQGGLVATYEVTSTSTATATYSSGNTYIVTNTTTSTASGTGPFIMGGNMTLSSTATSGGTGIGCSGTCSTGNWAQFTDSTHITNVAAPTYVSVGADAAGAAAAAVNAAIPSGTVGGLTYLSGAHTLATTAPASQTPTANTVPISNSSGTLNSWVTNTRVTDWYSNYASSNLTTPANGCIALTYVNVTSTVTSNQFLIWSTAQAHTNAEGNLSCEMVIQIDGANIGLWGVASLITSNAQPSTMSTQGIYVLSPGPHTITSFMCQPQNGWQCVCNAATPLTSYETASLLVQQYGY